MIRSPQPKLPLTGVSWPNSAWIVVPSRITLKRKPILEKITDQSFQEYRGQHMYPDKPLSPCVLAESVQDSPRTFYHCGSRTSRSSQRRQPPEPQGQCREWRRWRAWPWLKIRGWKASVLGNWKTRPSFYTSVETHGSKYSDVVNSLLVMGVKKIGSVILRWMKKEIREECIS